ncbi:MAG TPA: hypothetical protein DDX98_12615 [Bacteroidales bacterium]|nr:hypothetical protein [Bacteroidales bacterium]
MGKKRIIKKYEQLAQEVLNLIQERYPDGYEDKLISFQSPSGELELALPLETDEVSYLIKMPKNNLPAQEEEDDTITGEDLGGFESLEAAENIADED